MKNLLVIWILTWFSLLEARPSTIVTFCEMYPESPQCVSGEFSCVSCHTNPPVNNEFGKCVSAGSDLWETDFEGAVRESLLKIENLDCDNDGISNIEEYLAGTDPGVANSTEPTTENIDCEDRDKLSNWNVCGYDPVYTYKRVSLDFCGKKANYQDLKVFKSLSLSEQKKSLSDFQESCLNSGFWKGRDGVVWQMAHTKVQPLRTLKSGHNSGEVPLGDYDDDYQLFVYYNVNDRDVRGLLTADHYVSMIEGGGATTYEAVDEMPMRDDASGLVLELGNFMGKRQQFVPKERRAGMLTTLWNATFRTMFTSIPRTNAAHAMRAYLGLDIAKSEGLIEPEGDFELVDHDNKGILSDDCSFCHRTLDAASYPFTKYNGLSFDVPGKDIDVGNIFDPNGQRPDNTLVNLIPENLVEWYLTNSKMLVPGIYKPRRVELLSEINKETEPELSGVPEAGYVLGKPVANLVEWGQVAANSDYFVKNIVLDYWIHLVGSKPASESEKNEYESLWKGLMGEDNYSVSKMLKKLVETEAYGAP